MVMHMNSPNMNFLINCGMMVNGIQNTARRRSLILRFSRNTFVTVLILWFCAKVSITSPFPTTLNMKIILYSEILIYPFWSNSDWERIIVPLERGDTLSLIKMSIAAVDSDIFSVSMLVQKSATREEEKNEIFQGWNWISTVIECPCFFLIACPLFTS